jgi:predicted site-specific integrase-resolvase
MASTEKLKRASKSVREFCQSYHISRRTFEHWQKKGIGPAITQPAGRNGRIVISEQAERDWLGKHTALTNAITTAAE